MKNSQLHALILGASFLISLTIVLVRISFSRRSTDASTEVPVATSDLSPDSGRTVDADAERKAGPLDEVEYLLNHAEELYKVSALEEGSEAEISMDEAQASLEKAGEVLETLPEDDPRVKELRRRWSALQLDVNRAAGF